MKNIRIKHNGINVGDVFLSVEHMEELLNLVKNHSLKKICEKYKSNSCDEAVLEAIKDFRQISYLFMNIRASDNLAYEGFLLGPQQLNFAIEVDNSGYKVLTLK